jgi:hypothetical protein
MEVDASLLRPVAREFNYTLMARMAHPYRGRYASVDRRNV